MRRLLPVLALLFLMAAPASAHTSIVSLSPGENEVLQTVPTQVVITTDDDVQEMGSAISVLGPSGNRVDDGSTEVDGKTVLVGLVGLNEPGSYTVNYRLIASDGHSLQGSYTFTLNASATSPVPTPSTSPSPTSSPTPEKSGSSSMWITIAAVVLALTSLALLVRRLRR